MINIEQLVIDAKQSVESRKPCTQVDHLIVDANNLLYRLSHIERLDPEKVVVAFIEKIVMLADWYGSGVRNTHVVWEGNSEKNWRFDVHPEYKATRKKSSNPGLRDCVRKAEVLLRKALSQTNFPQWDPVDAEGDDGFATVASWYKEKQKVGIYSTDRDLLQLADKNVVLIVPQRGASDVAMSEADVLKNYGVTTSQLLDIKALEGDAGDNIPGIRGIGRKYAVEIIQKCGSYQKVWEDLGLMEQQESETQKAWRERLKAKGLTPARLERLKDGAKSGDMSYIVGAIKDNVSVVSVERWKTSVARFLEDFPYIKTSWYLKDNLNEFLFL